MAKTAVHKHFYGLFDYRLDLAVDAEPETLSHLFAGSPDLAESAKLRLVEDVPSGSDTREESKVRIFRTKESGWTQVMCRFRPNDPFSLARRISEDLACRCVLIEQTDDAWGGHVLFDRGKALEVNWCCSVADVPGIASKLDLSIPEFDMDGQWEETDLVCSSIRSVDQSLSSEAGGLESLARELGFSVSDGAAVWSKRSVQRLDLLFEEQ